MDISPAVIFTIANAVIIAVSAALLKMVSLRMDRIERSGETKVCKSVCNEKSANNTTRIDDLHKKIDDVKTTLRSKIQETQDKNRLEHHEITEFLIDMKKTQGDDYKAITSAIHNLDLKLAVGGIDA